MDFSGFWKDLAGLQILENFPGFYKNLERSHKKHFTAIYNKIFNKSLCGKKSSSHQNKLGCP